MPGERNFLNSDELDSLLLSTPEARASYEESRLAYQVGCDIRKIRDAEGLSEERLAQLSRIDAADVQRIERGGAPDVTLSMLGRIAHALGRQVAVTLGVEL